MVILSFARFIGTIQEEKVKYAFMVLSRKIA